MKGKHWTTDQKTSSAIQSAWFPCEAFCKFYVQGIKYVSLQSVDSTSWPGPDVEFFLSYTCMGLTDGMYLPAGMLHTPQGLFGLAFLKYTQYLKC